MSTSCIFVSIRDEKSIEKQRKCRMTIAILQVSLYNNLHKMLMETDGIHPDLKGVYQYGWLYRAGFE